MGLFRVTQNNLDNVNVTVDVFNREMAHSSMSDILIGLVGSGPSISHIIQGHTHPTDQQGDKKPADNHDKQTACEVSLPVSSWLVLWRRLQDGGLHHGLLSRGTQVRLSPVIGDLYDGCRHGCLHSGRSIPPRAAWHSH